MKALADCLLYAFIDTAYLHGRDPAGVALDLCKGGADMIQIRAKDLPMREIRQMAEAVLPITRSYKVNLVINDHLEAAQEAGAEFCHLGQEDFAGGYGCVAELPRREGLRQPRIGLSTHAPEQAKRAMEAGADYIAIGPVYATPTKPQAKPVTLDYVRWAVEHVTIPWFAIGGINLERVDEVLAAGARRICVVSAILDARHPVHACQEFKERVAAANKMARGANPGRETNSG